MVSTSKPDTQPSGQPGVTRRSVAKTAAHAAWAVPAIQIATAVPAFASSTDTNDDVVIPTSLVATGLTSDNKAYQTSFKVFNNGPATRTVSIEFTATSTPKFEQGSVDVPAGWTVTPNPIPNNTSVVQVKGVVAVAAVRTAPHEATIVGPTLRTNNGGVPTFGTPTITYS